MVGDVRSSYQHCCQCCCGNAIVNNAMIYTVLQQWLLLERHILMPSQRLERMLLCRPSPGNWVSLQLPLGLWAKSSEGKRLIILKLMIHCSQHDFEYLEFVFCFLYQKAVF